MRMARMKQGIILRVFAKVWKMHTKMDLQASPTLTYLTLTYLNLTYLTLISEPHISDPHI